MNVDADGRVRVDGPLTFATVSVRLADVASVVEAGAPRFGDALIQGRPGVLVALLGQYGATTRSVTLAVERALDALRPVFEREGITLYPGLQRPATFIEAALRNLRGSLLLGGMLVGLVLFLGGYAINLMGAADTLVVDGQEHVGVRTNERVAHEEPAALFHVVEMRLFILYVTVLLEKKPSFP